MTQPPTHTWTVAQTIDLVESINKTPTLAKAFLDPTSVERAHRESYQQKLCLQLLQRTDWMRWMRREGWIVLGVKGLKPTEKWAGVNPVKEQLEWLKVQHITLCTRLGNHESASAMPKNSIERRYWNDYKDTGEYGWYFTYHKPWMANSPAAVQTRRVALHPLAEAAFKSGYLRVGGGAIGALSRHEDLASRKEEEDEGDIEFVEARQSVLPVPIPIPASILAPVPTIPLNPKPVASGDNLSIRNPVASELPSRPSSVPQLPNHIPNPQPVGSSISGPSTTVTSSEDHLPKPEAKAGPSIKGSQPSSSTTATPAQPSSSTSATPAQSPSFTRSTPTAPTLPAPPAPVAAAPVPHRPLPPPVPSSSGSSSTLGKRAASPKPSSPATKRGRPSISDTKIATTIPKQSPAKRPVIVISDSDESDDDHNKDKTFTPTISPVGKTSSKSQSKSHTSTRPRTQPHSAKSPPSPSLAGPSASATASPSRSPRSRFGRGGQPPTEPLSPLASTSASVSTSAPFSRPKRKSRQGIATPPPETISPPMELSDLQHLIQPRKSAREHYLPQRVPPPIPSPVRANPARSTRRPGRIPDSSDDDSDSDSDSDSDVEREPEVLKDDHYSGIILNQNITLNFDQSPDLPEGGEDGPRLSLSHDDLGGVGDEGDYDMGDEGMMGSSRPQTPSLPNSGGRESSGMGPTDDNEIIMGERAEETEEGMEDEVEGMMEMEMAYSRPPTPASYLNNYIVPKRPSSAKGPMSGPTSPPLPSPPSTASISPERNNAILPGILIPTDDNMVRPTEQPHNLKHPQVVENEPPALPVPAAPLPKVTMVLEYLDESLADEDAFLAALCFGTEGKTV